jgi:FdrA protein
MSAAARIFAGRYVDSVVLMRLAQALAKAPGVVDAAAVMATEANRRLLAEGGFTANGAAGVGANDLIVAVKALDEQSAAAALGRVDELLQARAASGLPVVRSFDEALGRQPESNVAVISLPGDYAAAEARGALERGLHVFLFSSNVALEDEIALKAQAAERGLLCMGPDCGTAIINGVGLGFANVVGRGPVGVVGAAGTGIQAVTTLLDRFGVGVSHAIGTGGRDVSDTVGGMTMLAGLQALAADEGTQAILVVGKPPGARTGAKIREAASSITKPVVVCFLGDRSGPATLDEAALAGARAVGVEPAAMVEEVHGLRTPPVGRHYVRGLYAGGTLAYEAQLVLAAAGLNVGSNAPLPGARALADPLRSEGHSVVDLGSEDFTRGRPHPMIDAGARRERLAAEAADKETAVILLDVVLGYGAASDPAGDVAEAIGAAAGDIRVVVSVCGSDGDPQGLAAQEQTLRRAGALVLPTNAAAARAAAAIVNGGAG